VIEAHHDAIATKRLTLHTQFPAEPVWLWVEPDLWQQAIANLLSNACRYTDSGGTLTLTLARHPRWAVITVADTGIGIASADQTAIFKRFYRVDAARSAEGFGLGLAITEQIITAHQGKITVLSHPGQGTCFTIRVPLAPDHES
jgi:signal transduction histidine kinase